MFYYYFIPPWYSWDLYKTLRRKLKIDSSNPNPTKNWGWTNGVPLVAHVLLLLLQTQYLVSFYFQGNTYGPGCLITCPPGNQYNTVTGFFFHWYLFIFRVIPMGLDAWLPVLHVVNMPRTNVIELLVPASVWLVTQEHCVISPVLRDTVEIIVLQNASTWILSMLPALYFIF
jgi:hypothetical protein